MARFRDGGFWKSGSEWLLAGLQVVKATVRLILLLGTA